jgi:hypothetical protein
MFDRKGTERSHLRRALSGTEIVISLTITAFLAAAVAAAYNASADAVELNDRFFRATQAGRVTLNQLVTEIRRADSVEMTPDHRTVRVVRPQSARMANETYREYRYQPDTKAVTLQVFFDAAAGPITAGPVHPLASNIDDATFGPPKKDEGDAGNNTTTVIRVPISLKVKVGASEVRLTGASGPRRPAMRAESRNVN